MYYFEGSKAIENQRMYSVFQLLVTVFFWGMQLTYWVRTPIRKQSGQGEAEQCEHKAMISVFQALEC